MHIVEREIRKKYRYSNLSYVFDVYMECEYRANLTQEEYDGLLPGEFRFDYESWERRLGISKKQLVRAIKELTVNNAVIVQTFKGRKGNSSKYFLTRFKEQNEELKGNSKGTETNLENTGVKDDKGTERGTQKEQKKVHSSRYNNLDIISNNIYSHIFDYWNSKGIIEHKALTPEREKSIKAALKIYKEDDILKAIDNYSEILSDEGYTFNYKWSLENFLKRKNALPLFMDGGERKINYDTYRKNNIGNQFKIKPKKAADF